MHTIIGSNQYTFKDKGSIYYTFIYEINTDKDVKKYFKELSKKYYKASHVCYAYRKFNNSIEEYSSDAGEPSGTAGIPILNSLRSNKLVNVCLFVAREFGGTKLGKTGLINIYSSVSSKLISNTDKKKWIQTLNYLIIYRYKNRRKINYIFKKYNVEIIEENFSDKISTLIQLDIKNEVEITMELADKNINFKKVK